MNKLSIDIIPSRINVSKYKSLQIIAPFLDVNPLSDVYVYWQTLIWALSKNKDI